MMSVRQQRQLIEAAFIPRVCRCTICARGLVTIEVSDPISDAVLLEVKGVPAEELMNLEAIGEFAAALQCTMPSMNQRFQKAR